MKEQKTLGQIAYEGYWGMSNSWDHETPSTKVQWQSAAQAVLASVKQEPFWRSVDVPPDDELENILLTGGSMPASIITFASRNKQRTHWAHIPPLPEVPKKDAFEEWVKGDGWTLQAKDTLRRCWDAALKSKEEA